MNAKRQFLALAALCLPVLLASCIHTRAIRYDNAPPPKAPDSPVLLLDASSIKRPYRVVGIVHARASRWRSSEDIVQALKDEARQLGADAIIDLEQGEGSGGVVIPVGSLFVVKHKETYSAKAVAWVQ